MDRKTRREFLEKSLLAAAAVPVAGMASCALDAPRMSSMSPNDTVRVAVIGVRGRGRSHIKGFKNQRNVEVAAICDADEGVIGDAMRSVPKAKYYKDIRKLLEDRSIDAVSIATPNHWHSLAAIWALQAGKHVYVEKPISHNVFEGRKVVEAARRYNRIVQHGTQSRSSLGTQKGIEFIRGGGLGRVKVAHALCFKWRPSIGKVDGPQKPPATCDYNLWTGPAEMQPLTRTQLHYDWHWVYNTGNGDIGNQGVHQMDIARWGLGKSGLPQTVQSLGGRFGYDDDGNTANTQLSLMDYGDSQILFEVRGLESERIGTTKVGVFFYCDEGVLLSNSYKKTAYPTRFECSAEQATQPPIESALNFAVPGRNPRDDPRHRAPPA